MDKNNAYDVWLADTAARHELQSKHIEFLKTAVRLDDAALRNLDSTLKKVTSFMKKLKSIGTTVTPASLLPELEKLNVSKFLDEIASNICESKMKISDLSSLTEFCVKVSSLYGAFPDILLQELRKHLPSKKTDTIVNPAKLRVDLRFLADLVLHGVFEKSGMQLLGAVLSFIINTDKTEYVNVSVLMPFCRSLFFDITGVLPLTQHKLAEKQDSKVHQTLVSTVFNDEQRNAVFNLFKGYFNSLLEHLNSVRIEMNGLQKLIKRQERTRGDASADDRQKFDQAKNNYERLLQNATDLSEYLGMELPEMAAEPSDDEMDDIVAKKLDSALSDGKLLLFPDMDTQLFYERLIDVSRAYNATLISGDSGEVEEKDDAENVVGAEDSFSRQDIQESINSVDLTNLDSVEVCSVAGHSQADEAEDDEEEMPEDDQLPGAMEKEEESDYSKMTDAELLNCGRQRSTNVREFFNKLTVCINRELIDNAVLEFITHFNRKPHRKRLVQHLLKPPIDRFDLLPFYARFIATIRPVLPDVVMQVVHELLRMFREFVKSPVLPTKKGVKKKSSAKYDEKVHVSNYISELVKFSILPKAEALACIRSLLVDLKQYKVDMLCTMIEKMGFYLYRSPESHAKMSVIMQVMRNKSTKIKDPRQQILLDNAYFTVLPPEEQSTPYDRLPPVHEFLQMKIISAENRLPLFRRIDWDDERTADFVLAMFSNPCRVRFEDLDRLASLVGALSDYHDWIGVYVVDEVLEFIRLYLEVNHVSLQQRGFSSIVYIGQLFNYNVCGTTLIIKLLYQLITFALQRGGSLADDMYVRVQRIRLVCELLGVVFEFFCKYSLKRRMDCFLTFFHRFYFETIEQWSEVADELGEFPNELRFTLAELLKTWRRGERFPTSLAEANEAVENLEKQYKTKVEEIVQSIRELHDDETRDERRLNCIMEEEEGEEDRDENEIRMNNNDEHSTAESEDEEEDGEEEENDGRARHRHTNDNGEPAVNHNVYNNADSDEEDQEIHVRKEHTLLPEDEDFMRDLDRMIAETMLATPVSLKGPMTDLEVPPLARQKFERKITFAPENTSSPKTNKSTNTSSSLLIEEPPNLSSSQGDSVLNSPQPLQMALMSRGKGNRTVLKAVRLESSENMHASWRKYQEARERERREMKQLTLAMNERMMLTNPDGPGEGIGPLPGGGSTTGYIGIGNIIGDE